MKLPTSLFALFFLAFSCDTTSPPLPPPTHIQTISLAVVDSGVTDAWLRVTFLDSVQNKTFRLLRDSELVIETRLFARETVVVDTGLLPNTSYSYKAYHQINGSPVDSTDRVFLRTMDTTSHNFTFQIDTLGDGGSSILRDVAIISESDIWAVGEMYLRDSTGQLDPMPYNAARWDGAQWSLIRIPVPIFCGSVTAPLSCQAIFAFGANDIWIASGIIIMRWNGSTFTPLCIPQTVATGTINKIWGTGSASVYCVGNNGTIAYYNGSSWQRIESGTMLPFQDIWGSGGGDSQPEIIAVASNKFQNQGEKILRIMRLGIEELSDSGLTWSLSGTWFIRQWRYYVAGSGVYQKRSLNPVEQWNLYPPGVVSNFYSHSIHGQGKNDIVVAGGFGEVVHFNGTSWLRYDQFTQLAAGNYYRIQIKGNMLAVCRSEFVPSSSAYRMAVKGVLMNCCDPSKKRKVKDMNRTLQPLSVITQFAHEFLFAVSLLVIPAYLFGQTNIRVNQDISVAGRDQNETSIAVSNINPNVIIAASNYVTPTVDYRPAYYRSLDAGGSWVEGILSLQHRHRVVT